MPFAVRGIALPRKKSVKKSAEAFLDETRLIRSFVEAAPFGTNADMFQSWLHDYAIIRAYTAFEDLMLDALVGAINDDRATISSTTGVKFPKHLTDEVCEYLVTGGGYFDFKGRDGLIKLIRGFVPEGHYLITVVTNNTYRNTLDQLSSLRNFAAHRSDQAKAAALEALGLERMDTAGSWLKRQGRLARILDNLDLLARDLKSRAPY